jgi:acyl phosphate:glycerol-3-phosphate acyltransferase
VLTGAGSLLVISPLTFVIDVITALSTIAISRYVSLGSIVGGMTAMICGILFFFIGHLDPAFFGKVGLAQLVFMVVAPALVILFHHDNIGRLLAGTERKIGQSVDVGGKSSAPNGTSNVKA